MRLTKRMAAMLAAVAVVGGGTGAALATGGPFGGGGDDRAEDLAAAINEQAGTSISPADVEAAFEQLRDERLAAAVAAGRITQAQADQIKAGEEFRETSRKAIAEAISGALGISGAELADAHQAGTSVADLAEREGVARSAVVAAVVTALEGLRADAPAGLADRFAAGDLREPAERIVEGHGDGHRGGPGGFRDHGGPIGGPGEGPGRFGGPMDGPPPADRDATPGEDAVIG